MDKRSIRVLLVEDNPDDAQLIVRELSKDFQLQTLQIVDTRKAFLEVLDYSWDIVLSDYSLPAFTAADALELVRQKSPEQPFIVISGTIGEEVAIDMIRKGAHDYILKDRMKRLNSAVARELEVAERKTKHHRLENKFSQLFHESGDLICTVRWRPEEHGNFDEVNRTMKEILGYPEEFWVQERIKDLIPENAPYRNEVFNALKEGQEARFETAFRKFSDEEVPIDLHIHRLQDESTGLLLLDGRNITAQKIAENELQKSLREKDMLLRELHHRVKNNLQIISSLLFLEMEAHPSPRQAEILERVENRIHSMAMVHQLLYRLDDLSNVSGRDYLSQLMEGIFLMYGVGERVITYQVDVEEVAFDANLAIDIGLIVNELVSNALKHAFPGRKTGKIQVSLAKTGEKLELRVEDDGVGDPETFKEKRVHSLGLLLIESLIEKRHGNISFEPNVEKGGGTKVFIQFR